MDFFFIKNLIPKVNLDKEICGVLIIYDNFRSEIDCFCKICWNFLIFGKDAWALVLDKHV